MRWGDKLPDPKHKRYDVRSKKKFLFIPKRLPVGRYDPSDLAQWRWLETAYIQQECIGVKMKKFFFWWWYRYYWSDQFFLEDGDYK